MQQGRRGFWYVLTLPLKALLGTVVLDGMGQGAWDVMLHRATNVFHRSEEFELDDPDEPQAVAQAIQQQPTGAFSVFLRRLEDHIRSESDRDPSICYHITFVAHSMGALAVNEALRLFPDLPVTQVVYMAAACSIRDVQTSVVPFLEAHRATEFHVLTLHPLAEIDEINFDFLPRGSLLEWIDNWYTTPTHALERRFGKWVNVMNALHILAPVEGQVTIKGFSVDRDSKPQKHGEFNQCPFWQASFWSPDGPLAY